MPQVTEGKISDLTLDTRNANTGTERGLAMLETSLRKRGAGRSVLLDRHGRAIAGNKTIEKAIDIGFEDVIIVKTDGTKLVAVQREDLDLDDSATGARDMAYLDNRVSEIDLAWDPSVILADLDAGLDLGGLWSKDELAEFELEIEIAQSLLDGNNKKTLRQLGDNKYKIKPVLYIDELATFEQAILAT